MFLTTSYLNAETYLWITWNASHKALITKVIMNFPVSLAHVFPVLHPIVMCSFTYSWQKLFHFNLIFRIILDLVLVFLKTQYYIVKENGRHFFDTLCMLQAYHIFLTELKPS